MTDLIELSPGVVSCPLCGCPVQRSYNGDLARGIARHYKVVHPGEELPA